MGKCQRCGLLRDNPRNASRCSKCASHLVNRRRARQGKPPLKHYCRGCGAECPIKGMCLFCEGELDLRDTELEELNFG